MSATTVRTATLLAATVAAGMSAGVFALYAHTIMPGLKTTDDRSFVTAFRAIDRSIMNLWFVGLTFFGALLLTVAAALTQLGRPPLSWILLAGIVYLVCVVTTLAVNVPANDALKAAGDPSTIDVAAVRVRFDEARWAAWNLIRVATSIAAFTLLAWALVAEGRS
jgi:uncharacterized membrane protein